MPVPWDKIKPKDTGCMYHFAIKSPEILIENEMDLLSASLQLCKTDGLQLSQHMERVCLV